MQYATHSFNLNNSVNKTLQLFKSMKFHLRLEKANRASIGTPLDNPVADYASHEPSGTFLLPASWGYCTVTVLYFPNAVFLVCEKDASPAAELEAEARRKTRTKPWTYLLLPLPDSHGLVPASPRLQAA